MLPVRRLATAARRTSAPLGHRRALSKRAGALAGIGVRTGLRARAAARRPTTRRGTAARHSLPGGGRSRVNDRSLTPADQTGTQISSGVVDEASHAGGAEGRTDHPARRATHGVPADGDGRRSADPARQRYSRPGLRSVAMSRLLARPRILRTAAAAPCCPPWPVADSRWVRPGPWGECLR
jgi:hypothetical protein